MAILLNPDNSVSTLSGSSMVTFLSLWGFCLSSVASLTFQRETFKFSRVLTWYDLRKSDKKSERVIGDKIWLGRGSWRRYLQKGYT